MTLEEFRNDIDSFASFVNFCWENGYDAYCEDIYSGDVIDDILNERLYNRIRDDSWWEVRDWLNKFEEGYSSDCYYREDEWDDDYIYLDDSDLYDMKSELEGRLIADGFFVEENEPEVEEVHSEPEPEVPAFEEFSDEEITNVFSTTAMFQAIVKEDGVPATTTVTEDNLILDDVIEEVIIEDDIVEFPYIEDLELIF